MDNILKSVRSILIATGVRWTDLTENVPADLLTRPAAEGEWSAVQCLQHLLDAEQFVFPVRVQAFLDGKDLVAFNPDAEGRPPTLAPAALAAAFCKLRDESIGLLSVLRPADLARQARHSELGPVTLSELLHEWAGHDLMHTVQAERALMQGFVQGSGPWRGYFADHDFEKK